MTKNRLLQIPGKEILDSTTDIKVTRIDREAIPDTHLIKWDSKNLIAPITQASLIEEPITEPKAIKIDIVAFVGKIYDLKKEDFSYYYNISLTYNSKYQLTIYMTFAKTVEASKDYYYYPCNIEFMKDSIIGANKNPIPLDQIETVEVVLVNRDPATSRGTVTTVQSTTGNQNY